MNGPTLTLAASCQGCDHLRIENRRTGQARYRVTVCGHPTVEPDRSTIDATGITKSTPAWCPLLHAARVALGERLAKESES